MMILPLAFGMPGGMELLLIAIVIGLLFGVKKIPQLANSLGRSLSEFKRGKKEGENLLKELEDDSKEIAKNLEEVRNGWTC